jgi:hypothetical protein
MKSTAILAFLVVSFLADALPTSADIRFRQKAWPDQMFFLITETGYRNELDGNLGSGNWFNWELGLMRNLTPNSALGATYCLGVEMDKGYGRSGFKARYRRRLNPDVHLDLSPGIVLWEKRSHLPEFTGHVGVSYRDWATLTAEMDVVRPKYGGDTEPHWYLGVKVGGYPGAGLCGVSAVVGAILLLRFAAAG